MVHDMKEAGAFPRWPASRRQRNAGGRVRLEREYFERSPIWMIPTQLVSFGTSGHRGSSLAGTFTEAHILAITQAICDYRVAQGTDGPLYMGKDTHALSAPRTAHGTGGPGGERVRPSSSETRASHRRR